VHIYVVHMMSEPQIVHLLEYCSNEVAADAEVSVKGGRIAAVIEFGMDVGIPADLEVDVEVRIGVDAQVCLEDCGIASNAEIGGKW